MTNEIKIGILCASVLFLAGCDFELPWQRKAREEVVRQEAVRREKQMTEQEETRGACAVLRQFVTVRAKMLDEDCTATRKELADLDSDRALFSKHVGALSDKSIADKNGTRENALYEMLKNEEINAIARRHLGNDFIVVRAEFAEKVRFAMKRDKERKTALAKNEEAFNSAVESTVQRTGAARTDSTRAAAAIQQEMKDLEYRMRKLQNDTLASSTRKQNIKDEISRIRNRLTALQSQYNSIRLAEGGNRDGRTGETDALNVRARALREKKDADKEVLDRLGGEATPFEIAAAYETLTIRKLDETMKAKAKELELRIELMQRVAQYLRLSVTGIEDFNLAALSSLRKQIDAELGKIKESVNGK